LIVMPMPLPAALRRYLAVVPRLLSAAPLAVRRRYLILVPRPLPAATLAVHRKYQVVVTWPLPAAQLVCESQVLDRGAKAVARGATAAGTWPWCPGRCPQALRSYLIVVPRPLPGTPLVARRRYLTLVPRPLPAAPLRVART
jgi:hypothetical protein